MKTLDKAQFDQQNVFGQGMANTAFAAYFIGNSYLNPLTKAGESAVGLANVTFEPGCRNNWHIHHAKAGGGQILICTAGEGWYQEEGKDAVSLTPARSSSFRRKSNPGMAPRPTAGFPTSQWKCPAKRPAMNGWNRWTTPALPNCRDRSGARAAGCRPPKEYAQARRGGGLFPREKTGLAPALPGERSFAL